jgi:hypothetical protein
MKKILISFLLVLNVAACYAQQHPFDWLLGTWKLENKNVFEVWEFSDENMLRGISYKVSGVDTTVMEKISLIRRGTDYFYVPEVAENNGAIEFRITSRDNDSFVAENPQHDFPKIIRYTIVRKQAGIFISASVEGNGKVIPYHFEKIK